MRKFMMVVLVSLQLIGAETGVPTLSAEVRSLLSQEMQAIHSGMSDIFEAMISGDNAQVMEVASRIEHSYLLKKALTPEQKQELRGKLPTLFFEYDMEFHATAQELANFAEFGDTEAVAKTYSSMINQCIRCHQTFAKQRFSGFQDGDE